MGSASAPHGRAQTAMTPSAWRSPSTRHRPEDTSQKVGEFESNAGKMCDRGEGAQYSTKQERSVAEVEHCVSVLATERDDPSRKKLAPSRVSAMVCRV